MPNRRARHQRQCSFVPRPRRSRSHGCLQRPWIVPIPGTTKLHRLEENLGAVNVEPTTDDLAEIERAASAITIQGARYPEQLEATTGR
jgi:hypothetical protein